MQVHALSFTRRLIKKFIRCDVKHWTSYTPRQIIIGSGGTQDSQNNYADGIMFNTGIRCDLNDPDDGDPTVYNSGTINTAFDTFRASQTETVYDVLVSLANILNYEFRVSKISDGASNYVLALYFRPRKETTETADFTLNEDGSSGGLMIQSSHIRRTYTLGDVNKVTVIGNRAKGIIGKYGSGTVERVIEYEWIDNDDLADDVAERIQTDESAERAEGSLSFDGEDAYTVTKGSLCSIQLETGDLSTRPEKKRVKRINHLYVDDMVGSPKYTISIEFDKGDFYTGKKTRDIQTKAAKDARFRTDVEQIDVCPFSYDEDLSVAEGSIYIHQTPGAIGTVKLGTNSAKIYWLGTQCATTWNFTGSGTATRPTEFGTYYLQYKYLVPVVGDWLTDGGTTVRTATAITSSPIHLNRWTHFRLKTKFNQGSVYSGSVAVDFR